MSFSGTFDDDDDDDPVVNETSEFEESVVLTLLEVDDSILLPVTELECEILDNVSIELEFILVEPVPVPDAEFEVSADVEWLSEVTIADDGSKVVNGFDLLVDSITECVTEELIVVNSEAVVSTDGTGGDVTDSDSLWEVVVDAVKTELLPSEELDEPGGFEVSDELDETTEESTELVTDGTTEEVTDLTPDVTTELDETTDNESLGWSTD